MLHALADKDTLLHKPPPATVQKEDIIMTPAEQWTCKCLARLFAGPSVRELIAVMIVDCTVVPISHVSNETDLLCAQQT